MKYIIPYSNNGEEYDQYLYLLKTNISTSLQGYIGQTDKIPITLINLLNVEFKSDVEIVFSRKVN